MDKENQAPQITLPEKQSLGVYTNFMAVNNSPTEFVMDFMSMMPGMQNPTVVSRVIMTPSTAKRMLMMLGENIRNYESVFGQITEPEAHVIRPQGEA